MTGRRKRLSADLPQHWLHDPAWWSLPDAAWRLHTHGLMWAIGRTDGHIPHTMLTMLLPGSDADRDLAVKALLDAGHWRAVPDGWQITDWDESQSTVEQITARRTNARERQARHRSQAESPVTSDVTNGVSTERHGTERQGPAQKESANGRANADQPHNWRSWSADETGSDASVGDVSKW